MDPSSSEPTVSAAAALAAFDPAHFGFHPHHQGWLKEFSGIPTVAFAPLAWPHAQVHSYDHDSGGWGSTNALKLLVSLQQSTWGFPPEETVPVNVLSILEDTGGAVLVAYDFAKGFNADGWLGFAIGFGSRDGEYYSHMLGVRQDFRNSYDLGWYLKVLQGYLAIVSGHYAMTWTFDPMRGANARLNLEKLGSEMINLTIDKYGIMHSSLYGDVPTDRFTAYWDLLSPAVHQRLHDVSAGRLHRLVPADVAHLPQATVDNVAEIAHAALPEVTYEIPGDIDRLLREHPERGAAWRFEMRNVLGTLMTSRRASIDDGAVEEGPIAVAELVAPAPYRITNFATGPDPLSGDRKSFYVLNRKASP